MKKYLPLLIISLLLITSCTTTVKSEKTYEQTKNRILSGKLSEVDISKFEDEYKDPVLYCIDSGVIDYYKGKYDTAIKSLDQADKEMESRIAKSKMEGIKTFLTNDLSREYGGEPYEVVFTNIFSALSYMQLGNLDEALVEVKQSDIRLTDFQLNLKESDGALTKTVFAITPDPFKDFKENYEGRPYNQSATADYLSMITYRGLGDEGNAEVDMRRLQEKGIAIDPDDVSVPEGKARVNILSLNGLIGRKEGHEFKSAHLFGSLEGYILLVPYKVSWPEMGKGICSVTSARVDVSNGESFSLEMLENLTENARLNLNNSMRRNYLRSWYRGYTKIAALAVTRDAAIKGAQESSNPLMRSGLIIGANAAFWGGVAGVNKVEVADTRMGMYFPDNITFGGITLDPGKYDFTITYRLSNGSTFIVPYKGVEVKAGTVNLLTPQCAR